MHSVGHRAVVSGPQRVGLEVLSLITHRLQLVLAVNRDLIWALGGCSGLNSVP